MRVRLMVAAAALGVLAPVCAAPVGHAFGGAARAAPATAGVVLQRSPDVLGVQYYDPEWREREYWRRRREEEWRRREEWRREHERPYYYGAPVPQPYYGPRY